MGLPLHEFSHGVLNGGVVQEAPIGRVLVGVNRRIRAHAIRDESAKGWPFRIGHDRRAHAASCAVLDARDDRLTHCATARPELLLRVFVALLATYKRLIGFDRSAEHLTILKVLSNPVRQEPR